MTDNYSSLLSIEVSLAPPPESDILSPFTTAARPSPSNIDSFYADPAQLDRAMDELRRLGFRVLIASRLSISVEGAPELFTEVFGTTLETRSVQEEPTVAERARPVAQSFLAPAPEAMWEPPAPLAGLVERAYIQQPYLYFERPLPPRVPYHHLRVPAELALLMDASPVHRQGTTGRGVKVAMIDSGFYIQHPYYVSETYNMSRILAPGAAAVEHDENGHGTAEAANILAIAPDATFIGVKAGPNLVAAFKETVLQNPDVISVSLGFDLRGTDGLPLPALPNFLKPLEAEISAAVASGITVVFSAGNGHISFPGMHPDVVSAGGAFIGEDMELQASDYASAFRSRIYPGRSVPDVAGLVGLQPNANYIMLPLEPGSEIDRGESNDDGTGPEDGWSVISGTSAAAPQLAGVCALLKQKNPGLSPAEIKEVLKRTARDVTKGHANETSNPVKSDNQVRFDPVEAGTGPDGATGHGLVDAFAAWQQV
jgi:subtilisin family serine protease